MRAIMVSVDYADLLAITLPYNRHHFEEVWVVTDSKSFESVRSVITSQPGWLGTLHAVVTDSFYDDGAVFNKWKALEWGLDQMGREGWLCVMDADVLWPRKVVVGETELDGSGLLIVHECQSVKLLPGQLCTPLRRMWEEWPRYPECLRPYKAIANGKYPPHESLWQHFPVHRNVAEWAGYSQIFHASDPVLGPTPWHQIDWRHAGGADSFFQAKWPHDRKVRPPFECLHLGPAGCNWFGRATTLADGTVPADMKEKAGMTGELWALRAMRRAAGKDPFGPERLGPDHP